VPCALILNELVTNALKHAFPAARGGQVRILFRQPAPGEYELAVEDDGIGMGDDVAGTLSKSLGMRIIEVLTGQLEGSFGREPCRGTRFVLRFADNPQH